MVRRVQEAVVMEADVGRVFQINRTRKKCQTLKMKIARIVSCQ